MIGGRILTEASDILTAEDWTRLVSEDYVADVLGAGRNHRRYIPVRFEEEEEPAPVETPKPRRLKQAEIVAKVEESAAYIAAGRPQMMSQAALVAKISAAPAVEKLLERERERVERVIHRYVAALIDQDEEEEEAIAMLLAA